MFESLGRSWKLSNVSLGVLRKDPELMLFPVVSFIAGVAMAGVLCGIGLATGSFGENGEISGLGVLLILLFYLGIYFATIYFQVALVASVKLRLSGGNPNLGYGIREANKRLGPILTWTMIAASVGLLLRLLVEMANRYPVLGRIVAQIIIGLVGLAWSLATFFVIPIIAYEGVGGFEAVKRSAGVIQRRWGDAVVAQAGTMLVMWTLAIVVDVVFWAIGIIALSNRSGVGLGIGILFIAVSILGVLFIIPLAFTLQSIYTTVLYEYATMDQTSEAFSRDWLDSAFRPTPQVEDALRQRRAPVRPLNIRTLDQILHDYHALRQSRPPVRALPV